MRRAGVASGVGRCVGATTSQCAVLGAVLGAALGQPRGKRLDLFDLLVLCLFLWLESSREVWMIAGAGGAASLGAFLFGEPPAQSLSLFCGRPIHRGYPRPRRKPVLI